MDIAELGLKIKLQGADEALRALKAVRDEAGKAESAIGRLENISGRADGTLRQLATGANMAEGAFKTLGTSFGNAGGAQSAFISQVKETEGAIRKAGDSLRDYQAELDHASQAQQSVGASVKTGLGPNKPTMGHSVGAETTGPGAGPGVSAGGVWHGPGAQPGKAPGTGAGTGLGGGDGAGEALGTSLKEAGTGAEKSSRSFDKLNSTLFDMGKSMIKGEEFSTVLKGSALDLAQGALEATVGLDGIGIAALAANPVVLGVGAAAAVAAGAFMLFKSDVNKAANNKEFIASLGLSKEQMEQLGDTSVTTGQMFTGLWNTIDEGGRVSKVFDSIKEVAINAFRGVIDGLKWAVATFIGGWTGAINLVVTLIKKYPAIVGDEAVTAAQFVVDGLETMINGAIKGLNWLGQKVNAALEAIHLPPLFGTLGEVKFDKINNPWHGTIQSLSVDLGMVSKSISDTQKGMDGFVEKVKSNIVKVNQADTMLKAKGIISKQPTEAPNPPAKPKTTVAGTTREATSEPATVAAVSTARASNPATVAAAGSGDTSVASFATNLANIGLTGGLGAAVGLNVAAGALANIAAAGAKVVSTASDAVATVNDGLAKTAESLHPVRDEIAGMGQDLAKAIVSGKNLGATFTDSLRKIAQEWMTSGIQKMFDALIGPKGSEDTGILGGIFDKAGMGGGLGKVLKGLGGLFGLGKNAMGTDNWRGGPTWVGERGPEIVNLPRGAQVIPNHRIGAASGGGAGGGGGPVEVRVHVDQDGNWQAAVGKIAGKVAGPIAQQAGSQAAMAGSQIAQSSMADRQRRSLRAV